MTIIHTVAQAFIVKDSYEDVCRTISKLNDNEIAGAGLEFQKLVKMKTSDTKPQYVKLSIFLEMIVAVEDKPAP